MTLATFFHTFFIQFHDVFLENKIMIDIIILKNLAKEMKISYLKGNVLDSPFPFTEISKILINNDIKCLRISVDMFAGVPEFYFLDDLIFEMLLKCRIRNG